ncbi:MAG: DUF4160 domain-containing protein [Lachnospiraceae bacterium]|nr:DUF4160 domain-containing protein [Lachnospiraceae bacterium]
MIYTIHFSVHVYAEDVAIDELLNYGSHQYGILGKELLEPLRLINDTSYFLNITNVEDLWNWTDFKLYGKSTGSIAFMPVLDFVKKNHIVQKYLMFNNLRYHIDNPQLPLQYYLQRMSYGDTSTIEVQLLINSDAGTFYKKNDIRIYMNTRENGHHNIPHIHVDIHHDLSATFSIIDGRQLTNHKILKKYEKLITEFIHTHRQELLVFWNEHTDGLTVDLNQYFNLIAY